MQVEVAVGAEVFAGKEFAIRLGNQASKLLVGELFELFWRDGASDSQLDGFHGMPSQVVAILTDCAP